MAISGRLSESRDRVTQCSLAQWQALKEFLLD